MRMKWKLDLWAIDFSIFFLDSAVYERRMECSLRRLLRDRKGTTPIEANNFDESKRRSLRSALARTLSGNRALVSEGSVNIFIHRSFFLLLPGLVLVVSVYNKYININIHVYMHIYIYLFVYLVCTENNTSSKQWNKYIYIYMVSQETGIYIWSAAKLGVSKGLIQSIDPFLHLWFWHNT